MLLCLWLLLCYQSSRDKLALKAVIVYYLSPYTKSLLTSALEPGNDGWKCCHWNGIPLFFFFLICFWLCWFFVAVHRVPLAAARGLLPFTVVFRLPFAVASHCRAGALGHMDFSSCDYRALEHGLSSCVMALVASWHVGSCRIRDWTWVPCIGMQILILWTAREDLGSQF